MPQGHIKVNAPRACPPENYAYLAVERAEALGHNLPMQHLSRIRKAKRLTQTRLAEAAGCNQATISKLERGDKNVTLDLIERIARVLGVAPWELFGIDELRQRYLSALERASPAKRQAVLMLLEGDEPSH
jgi:transcriptional regulator with XRE-family HTH domain